MAPVSAVTQAAQEKSRPPTTAELEHEIRRLEARIAQQRRDLFEARSETRQLLSVAAEYRDDETAQHTERVGAIAAEIASHMGLGEEKVQLLREAAPLHDLGKIAIPDRILRKPGELDELERTIMQTHAERGSRLLAGSRSPVLQLAAVIAVSHHEHWDGSGYPHQLRGEEIPLVGRIVAVADTFDALTHERPYKQAWPRARALEEIHRHAGSRFDPNVVSAFASICREVSAAAKRRRASSRAPARLTAAPARRPIIGSPPRAAAAPAHR